MPDTVCCPSCWAWSELGRSATCKRCGTPLIFADGRAVQEPQPPPLPPSLDGVAAPTMSTARMPTFSFPAAPRGVDWVALTRWITVGYGALACLGLIVTGLLVRHLTVSAVDASTGRIVHQTVDIGPAMVVVALVVALLFALFAWLTQFAVFRVVMLVVVAAGALAALARVADGSTAVVFASLGSVLIDAGLCFVLVMSLLARRRDT